MMRSKKAEEIFDVKNGKWKKSSFLSKVFFALFIIYICLFIVFMAFVLDFRCRFVCVPVEGTSMQPTINSTAVNQSDPVDWVYVEKHDKINRQDIVVFDAIKQEGDEDELCLIKRVIALEGDAVTIRRMYSETYKREVYTVCLVKAEALEDGEITYNEVEALQEDYISSAVDWTWSSQYTYVWQYEGTFYESEFASTFLTSGKYEVVSDADGILYAKIPEDSFFYLGDNRPKSSDSRKRGADLCENVIGTVRMIMPEAAESSSTISVQFRAVFSYYTEIIGNFFSNLWISLENIFAI